MSNINEEQVQKMLELQEQKFNDKIERANGRSGSWAVSADYDTVGKFIHEADGTIAPTFDRPVLDHEKWMSIFYPNAEQAKALAGNTDKDLEEDCYTNEYRGLYQEFKHKLNDAKLTGNSKLYGSVITSNDFSVLRVVADVSRVLGFQLQANILEQAVTVQSTPNLVARYQTWSGFEVMPNVGEGVIVEAKKGSMAENTFKITKDVGAAAITIEAELTTQGDIFADHVTWIAKKMRKLKNTKIATVLATITATHDGTDWDAYSAGFNTNDPGVDFATVVNTLNAQTNATYKIDTIVSGTEPRRIFFNNTFIKGIFTPNVPITNSPISFGTPGIEGNPTWYVDQAITPNTVVYAYAKEVVVDFEGPKRTTEIGRPDAEVREYYNRDFNSVFIVDQQGAYKITAVTT